MTPELVDAYSRVIVEVEAGRRPLTHLLRICTRTRRRHVEIYGHSVTADRHPAVLRVDVRTRNDRCDAVAVIEQGRDVTALLLTIVNTARGPRLAAWTRLRPRTAYRIAI